MTIVATISVAAHASAPCRRFDFDPPPKGSIALMMTLATWSGGTEAQCSEMRSKVAGYWSGRVKESQDNLRKDADRAQKARTASDKTLADRATTADAKQAADAATTLQGLKQCACLSKKAISKPTPSVAAERRPPTGSATAPSSAPNLEPQATASGSTHAEWAAREAKRKKQQHDIEDEFQKALDSESNEATRHALTDRELAALDAINRARHGDPEPSAAQPGGARTQGISKEQFDLTRAGFGDVLKKADRSLVQNLSAARRSLSAKQFERYAREVSDLRGVLNGLGKMIEYADYPVLAAAALKETGLRRDEAVSDLSLRFAGDLGRYGVKKVAPMILGPEALAVLGGPVAWVAGVAANVLTPVRTSLDFSETIRSPRASLAEKQQALNLMWRAFATYGDHWGTAYRTELLACTEIVYRQASGGSQ